MRPSGLPSLIKDHLAGGASRLAALLLPQILPVSSVVAPCQAGAALRDLVLVRRGQATSGLPGILVAMGLAACVAPAASAQISEPDTTNARVSIGPVMMNPGIDLTQLGIDTNVFNAPEGQERQDFTFTLTPRADVWMKFGPTWITGNVHEDFVWYQTYSNQRAANNFDTINWIVPLNRLRFSAGASYLNAKDRPGFEIDARVPHQDVQLNGAAELRAFARLFFGARASRLRVDFADDAAFLGSALRFELNRTTTSGAVTTRYELTPLTSISVDAGRTEDRFEFSPLRDANSTTAGVQVTLDPSALIKGSARVGYRNFAPLSADVQAFRGTTAAVDLSYVLLGTTKFGVQVGRDVQFSYDVNQPYYIQTGVSASIAQQIYGPMDAVAGFGLYSLAYRDLIGAPVQYADRIDRDRSFNGGVGYHAGKDLRIGVKVEKDWRVSEVQSREYSGFRVGMSVTYGS